MTPQEMLPLLNIEADSPPWEGEVKEIQATVMANRQPVRVRVLEVYEYCGRKMARVQALRGEPFSHTNMWHDTWYSDKCNTHAVFLQDVTLMY